MKNSATWLSRICPLVTRINEKLWQEKGRKTYTEIVPHMIGEKIMHPSGNALESLWLSSGRKHVSVWRWRPVAQFSCVKHVHDKKEEKLIEPLWIHFSKFDGRWRFGCWGVSGCLLKMFEILMGTLRFDYNLDGIRGKRIPAYKNKCTHFFWHMKLPLIGTKVYNKNHRGTTLSCYWTTCRKVKLSWRRQILNHRGNNKELSSPSDITLS